MKIAIDASRAVIEKAGIGRYSLELIKKIIEIDHKNEYFLLFSYFRKDIQKERIIKSFQGKNVTTKIYQIPGGLKEKMWGWRVSWFKKMLPEDIDLFYGPSFLEINLGLKIPQIVTIYDLTTFLFPEHRGQEVSKRLNERTKKVCQKVRKIIAISKSTANDLENILKISPQKIQVIYPGRNNLGKPAAKLPAGLKKGSYLLTVGTIEPRKNLTGLLKSYALLPLKIQEKYPLIICGAKGWQTGDIMATYLKLKLEGKVKFLGYVPDSQLAKLYQEAALFIYPSIYEGFGFPVLEALSYKTPVICSQTSSLPEVAGKAACYINPDDPKSISSAIQGLLEHTDKASALSHLAEAQSKRFSWEKAAYETIKVFEEYK